MFEHGNVLAREGENLANKVNKPTVKALERMDVQLRTSPDLSDRMARDQAGFSLLGR